MDDITTIRALVESGWNPGDTGKGLLAHVDQQPPVLFTWRTLSWSGPHHSQVVTALGLPTDDVAAYINISAEGDVDILLGGLDLREQLLELDPRLRIADWTWRFD